jgi:D-alanyl-D-alanine carboxypeptidase (penicillin-binding protein 5/6)
MLLPSANDAAEDLAYNVGHGSVAQFVAMMNVRARELGLIHTHYATPVGLDTPGNYSSATDLVKLARFLLIHHPFFRHTVALPSAVLETGSYVRHIVNRNDLIGRIPWVNGVKTGHTLDAGYVMVGSGTRGGMTLIASVLGASSEAARDANTVALLDWGFANYRLVHPVRAGAVLVNAPVTGQPKLRAQLVASRGVSAVVARSAPIRIRFALRRLAGPMPLDALAGTAIVLAGDKTIARIPLHLAAAIPAPPSSTTASRLIAQPFTLLALALLVVVAAALLRRRRTRGRDTAGPEPA